MGSEREEEPPEPDVYATRRVDPRDRDRSQCVGAGHGDCGGKGRLGTVSSLYQSSITHHPTTRNPKRNVSPRLG